MKRFVAAALLAVSLPARAQLAQSTSVDVQRFKPAATSGGLLTLEGATTRSEERLYLAAYLNYAHNPLVLVDADGDPFVRIVEGQIGLDLVGSWTFRPWLEVGAALPVTLFMFGLGTDDPGEVSRAGLGDLRIVPKFVWLHDPEDPLGVAFALELRAPTHSGEFTGGERNALVAPKVLVEHSPRLLGLRAFRFVANVGAVLREGATVEPGLEVGHELTFGAGASWRPGRPYRPGAWEVLGELTGQAGLEATDREEVPLEALAAVRHHRGDFAFDLGGGAGLVEGYGAPTFRVLAGVRYEPSRHDADRDGILDENDRCPNEPEDRDGFEDTDGCPDPDNDKDGVRDENDRCPETPEDRDGFEDEDGCPDGDNDGDGIADGADKCPTVAEDKDGFEDTDGCPDPDNDKDGIPDAADKCPNVAEDKDGWQDEDGCPDPDNDLDGVLDADDKCPTEKETINGVDDEDGCPDKGKVRVKVTAVALEITDKVFFETDSDAIKPQSFGLLGQVALHLKANPHIRKVRVEGHTDSRGSREHNLDLSQRRAESVRRYLVERGVDAARLDAQGFGPDRPLASNKSSRGRRKNRRVEFVIVEASAPAAPLPVK